MKIVIAPSKTMVTTKIKPDREALFDYRKEIIKGLKALSVDDLITLFDVNQKIALQNYERFQNFEENNIAIFAYTGQQFKHLDATSLEDKSLTYLDDHLFIMSGLYGLVRPFDGVGLYRLPMGVKWDGTLHKNNWKPIISNYLEGEVVINLASKEYSDAIDTKKVKMITIDFMVEKNGKMKKAPAMEAKRLRGLMVRKMAEEKIQSIDALKTLSIDGYGIIENLSDSNTLKYKRN